MLIASIALVVTLLIGLIRVARGPSLRERLMGLALGSSTGTAILLLLAEATGTPALRDAALALVALAALIVCVRVLSGDPTEAAAEPDRDPS